jgi:hypothetical protein
MILIAHRGNINGPNLLENEPSYIDLAISNGFDVEIDVWFVNGELFLGHDEPQYNVEFKWFVDRISKLWVHCKNVEAIIFFKNSQHAFNYFWHENDTLTLTSHNHIWVYPSKQPIQNSIAVMPEIYDDDTTQCLGICSDFVEKYK